MQKLVLEQFLTWLADTQPETFTKYNRNFQESTGDGYSLAVNPKHRITEGEFHYLLKIAQEWLALKAA